MNKKAQANVLGGILLVFITVLVGVVLFQVVAQEAGKTTTASNFTNLTLATGGVGVRVDVTGQDLLSTPIVYNATAFTMIADVDYTMDEIVSTTTGVKTISFLSILANTSSQNVNITYDYGADGYVSNSGARAMIALIAVFFALAIAVVALEPTLRNGILNMGK